MGLDILSYAKASSAKRKTKALNTRLGVGVDKNGPLDVKGSYANVKTRLTEMEKLRQGIIIKKKNFGGDYGFEGLLKDTVILNGNLTLKRDLNKPGIRVSENMVSNTTPKNTVNASHNSASAYVAFNDSNTAFQVPTNGEFWVEYIFDKPTRVSSYDIFGGVDTNSFPNNIRLTASRDGLYYDSIHTARGFVKLNTGEQKTFSFPNENLYTHYRFELSGSTHSTLSSLQKIVLYEPAAVDSGEWVSDEITLTDDVIEFDKFVITGENITTSTVKLFSKTVFDDDFKPVSSNALTSKFDKKVKLKVVFTYTGVIPEIETMEFTYKCKTILNRISEVERHTNINLQKHNLRVSALINQSRYHMKEMIVDDFSNSSGIDYERSTGISHNASLGVVKADPYLLESELVTIIENVEPTSSQFLVTAATGGTREDNIICHVSFNDGYSWVDAKLDNSTEIKEEDRGTQLRVKLILRPGHEVYGLSYAWA